MDEVCVAAIPAALTARAQWVVWRAAVRGGALTPVPFRADGGGEARADDPATWAPFAQALTACRAGRFAGVGFVFSAHDPFAGLALDDCRDPATGKIAPWARALLDRLDTYCEVSPSGAGVRAWVRAQKPGPGARRTPHVEMCGRSRCLAVTGRRLPEYPPTVEARQATYRELCEHIFAHAAAARVAPLRGSGGVPAEAARRTAQRAAAWLARTGAAQFTRRDAQRALSATADQADAALALLVEAGRLRALPPARRDNGQPRSPAFQVNPERHPRARRQEDIRRGGDG